MDLDFKHINPFIHLHGQGRALHSWMVEPVPDLLWRFERSYVMKLSSWMPITALLACDTRWQRIHGIKDWFSTIPKSGKGQQTRKWLQAAALHVYRRQHYCRWNSHDQPDGAAQQWLARINKRREEFFKLFRRFAEVEPRTETPWTTWGLGLDISSYWLRANVVYFVIYVSRSFILNVVGRNVMIGCVSPQALGFDWLRVVYLHTLLTNRWCCVQCNSYYLSRVLCILS